MAHPYTTEERLQQLVGTNILARLTDLDASTQEADVLAGVIEDACSEIDGALAMKYAVPFAGIADSSPTPSIITTICNYIAASLLYMKRHPEGNDHISYRAHADRLLGRITSGDYAVPGAAEAEAEDAGQGFSWSSTGPTPTFAGHDANGTDRMDDW